MKKTGHVSAQLELSRKTADHEETLIKTSRSSEKHSDDIHFFF